MFSIAIARILWFRHLRRERDLDKRSLSILRSARQKLKQALILSVRFCAEPKGSHPLPIQIKYDLLKQVIFYLAEGEGFEPSRACAQHAFQACAIGH